ncbi:DUF6205 family protein [Streptomyces sp. NPDC015125]|uniref:DUF6205 family protein n=1 Tax=Streptomyces sp. NPDC015125 TaxID=3364938 RepID=UPI0036FD1B0E
MGYYTAVSGQILIDPPLRGTTLKKSPFSSPRAGGETQRCLRLDIKEEPAGPGETGEPVARRVISVHVERLDAFDMEGELQELIDAFPGHTFTGRLQCMGDDHWNDMWGVIVRNGHAEEVKPTVIWPGDANT